MHLVSNLDGWSESSHFFLAVFVIVLFILLDVSRIEKGTALIEVEYCVSYAINSTLKTCVSEEGSLTI